MKHGFPDPRFYHNFFYAVLVCMSLMAVLPELIHVYRMLGVNLAPVFTAVNWVA